MRYIANNSNNTVSEIDPFITSPLAKQVIIPIGKSPIGIATDPNARKVYVTSPGYNTVSVIDEKNCRCYNSSRQYSFWDSY
jgi:DNA-binding beta-propeller fold protein YncE